MTCHCKTHEEHAQRAVEQSNYSRQAAEDSLRRQAQEREAVDAKRIRELSERSPNPDDFRVVDFEQVDKYLVLKVRYPSCKRCSFDQCKVLVFSSTTMKQALGWTRIDPHFQKDSRPPIEAPSPSARFPASSEGWSDAIAYARSKKPL